MLKKLIAGAAGAGLVLTMAGSAAFGWSRSHGGIFIDQDGYIKQDVDQTAKPSGKRSDIKQRAELTADQNYADVLVDCGCSRKTKIKIDQDGTIKQYVDQYAGGKRGRRGGDATQKAFLTANQNTAFVTVGEGTL